MLSSAQPAASTILTQADVQRLLRDDSSDSRVAVLEHVTQHYNSAGFGERERVVAEQIFRLLMQDAVLRVRETLAQRLKDNHDIPRDIVLHMAHDVATVALPVLEVTQVLSDADLVEIVEISRDLSKLMAISKRPKVSERVSGALVETNYPQVVSSLLGNDGAAIPSESYEKILTQFRGDESVMEVMVDRAHLPMTVVEKLVTQASEAVANQLKQKYKLSDDQIEKDAASTRDDVMMKLLRHDISDREVLELVSQMASEKHLSHSLVMTALCRGHLMFFTAALAHLANVSLVNAKRLVADRGGLGFKGIYDKSGLPASMMEAISLVLGQVKEMDGGEALPGSLLYANRLVERLLTAAGDHDVEYLPYFMALIRQNVQRH